MFALLQIFFEPDVVFERVRERRTWKLPFIAGMVVTLLVVAAMVTLADLGEATRRQILASSRGSQMDQKTLNQTISAVNSPVTKTIIVVTGVVGGALTILAIAGLLTGAGNVMSRKAGFTDMIAVTSFAFFPFGVLSLAILVAILTLTDQSALNINDPVPLNVGAFLDPRTNPALAGLASSIDLLSFGRIALLSYGFSKVTGVKMGAALALVVGLWLIYVVLKVGALAIFA
jgi:hypothetical protein